MGEDQTLRDLLLRRPAAPLVGRDHELRVLGTTLQPDGPLVVFVHGIGGMGKSALLERFAQQAEHGELPGGAATVVRLDCRQVEPTAAGFLEALAGALADLGPAGAPSVPTADHDPVRALAEVEGRTLLVLDTFEALRLADTWFRRELLPSLPADVRVVVAGRHPPSAAWRASGADHAAVRTVALRPLAPAAALEVLDHLGLGPQQAERVQRLAGGHPLLLQVAGAAVAERPWLEPDDAAVPETLEAVTDLYLRDLDPETRRSIDAASVVRRANVPLLAAMLPGHDPRAVHDRLLELPFVSATPHGLAVHEALQPTLAAAHQAADPAAHRAHRRAAWRELRAQLRAAERGDAWRCTADMLYLIGNPVVREAFFPTRAPAYVVEAARPDDAAQVEEIARRHEPEAVAGLIGRWWTRARSAFRVARDPGGAVVGFSAMLERDEARDEWLDDPISRAWVEHLEAHPVAPDEEVLLLPRWLTQASGELPDDVQAAMWLDIKGAYTERRPRLRRLYTVVRDLRRWAPIVGPLGLRALEGGAVDVDGHAYHPVVLDFGPGSVDGWLADLVADEMGVRDGPVLDERAHVVEVGEDRIELTPLELGVLDALVRRRGRPATRVDLLRDVWGTDYEGGSNVVAAVVHTLRAKLGAHARMVETQRGVGYRYRAP